MGNHVLLKVGGWRLAKNREKEKRGLRKGKPERKKPC